MEPRCRLCTRLAPSANSDPRVLEGRYRSYAATRRQDYCDPRRCNAKVGTDARSVFDSAPYDVQRLVTRIQELNRNAQDVDRPRPRDVTDKVEQKSALDRSVDARLTDLNCVHHAVQNCLLQIEKIKTFLEDENVWWQTLKERSAADCCRENSSHLHGVLDGSAVVLKMQEEESEKTTTTTTPRFASTPKKESDIVNFSFRTSSRELTSEINTEQLTGTSWEERMQEYADSPTVPCYSFNVRSTLIEAGSNERYDPTERHAKATTRGKQGNVPSKFWVEVPEGGGGAQRAADRAARSKETRDQAQFERRERRADRSNVVPPREIWYGQSAEATYEDTPKPRETFSSENTAKRTTADFASNVDLGAEIPARNTVCHKSRTRTATDKINSYAPKSPAKTSKIKSRD